MLPKWTVHYNIVSKERSPDDGGWVGTGWEFFTDEMDATTCYDRQIAAGNCPTKRPYYDSCDRQHLGAGSRMRIRS